MNNVHKPDAEEPQGASAKLAFAMISSSEVSGLAVGASLGPNTPRRFQLEARPRVPAAGFTASSVPQRWFP